jgi:hypothetical protein
MARHWRLASWGRTPYGVRPRYPGCGGTAGQAAKVELSMIPPPRQTSPSYSTADWPGVTAHWASMNFNAKSEAPSGAISQATSAWR